MNSLTVVIPFKTLSNSPKDFIRRKLSPEGNFGRVRNLEECVSKVFIKYLKNVAFTTPIIWDLCEKKILKQLHYQFTIRELFIYYLEERVALLNQHSANQININQKLNELKIRIAEASWYYNEIDLETLTVGFVQELNAQLKLAGIEDDGFADTLTKLAGFFKYPFLQDTPLIAFLEKKLQNPKGKTDSVESIDIPVSSFLQSIELMLRTFRKDLLWVQELFADYKAENEPIAYDLKCTSGRIPLEHLELYANIVENFHRANSYLVELQEITQIFDNFPRFISNNMARKVALDRLEEFFVKASNAFAVTSTACPVEGELETLLKNANRVTKVANVFLTLPALRLQTFKNQLLISWIQLDKSFSDKSLIPSYLQTTIPIIPPSKSQALLVSTSKAPEIKSKRKKRQRGAKPAPKEERAQEAGCSTSASIEEDLPNLKAITALQPLIASRQLQNFSSALIQFAKQGHNAKQREALIHASWHLVKCDLLHELSTNQKIAPESYLNLFTAFCFSAALSLEQLYRFHLSDKKAVNGNHHNLLTLHNEALPATSTPKATQNLKLAIIWTRYFHLDQYETLHHYTFHRQNIAPLVTKLLQLSSDSTQFSLRDEINSLHSDLVEASRKILPCYSKPIEAVPPIPLTSEFEIESVSQTIENVKRIPTESMAAAPRLTMRQLEDTLKMLEDSRKFLEKPSTYEEFHFWAMRCLFLVEEASELSMRVLDTLKNGNTIRTHNLDNLSTRVGINIDTLSASLQGMALKLKYPVSSKSKSLGAKLIDQLEALKNYPELDDGATVSRSALIPEWKLPLKNVYSKEIISNLNLLIAEMRKIIEEQIISEIINSIP